MAWTSGGQPPPGWYPDPGGAPELRWWDGGAWTTALAPLPATPLPATPPPGGGASRGRRTDLAADSTRGRRRTDLAADSTRGRRRTDLAADSTRVAFPPQALWFALAGAVVALLLLSGVGQLLGAALFPGSSAAQILFGEIGLWCGLGGTCLLASRRFGTGSVVADYGWRVKPADLGYAVAAAVACIFAAGFVGSAFSGTRLAGSNTQIITNQHGNTAGVAVVTLIAAVGAPIFEELFFRGLLRQALAGRLGLGAIWVQALFFGLAHFQPGIGLGNVSVVAATAAIGVVLGYTTSLTGRLGADSIAHGLFNLTVTLTIIGVIR